MLFALVWNSTGELNHDEYLFSSRAILMIHTDKQNHSVSDFDILAKDCSINKEGQVGQDLK